VKEEDIAGGRSGTAIGEWASGAETGAEIERHERLSQAWIAVEHGELAPTEPERPEPNYGPVGEEVQRLDDQVGIRRSGRHMAGLVVYACVFERNIALPTDFFFSRRCALCCDIIYFSRLAVAALLFLKSINP
jgi:hypothetical protein